MMKRLLALIFGSVIFSSSIETAAQPIAEFNWLSLCSEISFTDLSTCDGCTIVSWEWDLGDGNTSNVQNPIHWYWAPGVYTVTLTVTDDLGNDTSITHQVFPDSGDLAVTFTVEDPSNCNSCDGSATAMVTGGSPPYLFQWFDPMNQMTVSATGLCAGIYDMMVTDANGCNVIEFVTVGNSTIGPATLVLDTIVDVDCQNNNSPGSITVHGANGTPPYSFEWFDNTGTLISDSSTLANVSEGDYTVSVIDIDGCGQTATYSVSNSSNLYVSLTSTPANCSLNGSLNTTVQGGNPPFWFLWSNGATTQDLWGLQEGVYILQVIDDVGCTLEATGEVDYHCDAVVTGRVYADQNQNCIQDAGEEGLPNLVIESNPGPFYTLTDSLGDYSLYTPELNSTVTVSNIGNWADPTCPLNEEINVSVAALGDTSADNDFGYYFDPNAFDLHIHPGWTGATPGFDKAYWIYYYNAGPAPVTATVRMEYDPAITFLNANLNGVHLPAENAVEWGPFTTLPSSSWAGIDRPEAFFNVPVSMSITDTICTHFEITPIVSDLNPMDNVVDICEPVTGSYDPNAKAVIPTGEGPDGLILPQDTSFFYTVHFQNTGNDTAFTVIVRDTLSPHLDPATIVPGASSHPYTFTMNGQGNLSFRFDEIYLVDSVTNEPLSHGYFNYSIRSQPNLPLGTVIENTAAIYFDFNEPIITNTTVNTIHMPVDVVEHEPGSILVYPNPAAGQVTIATEASEFTYELTDGMGRVVKSGFSRTSSTVVQTHELPSGVYQLEISSKARLVTQKLVLSK